MTPIAPSAVFLRSNNPSYNLSVLSQMHRERNKTEICTQEIFKALPPIGATHLGLKNRTEVENHFGDAFLASFIALGALAILGVTAGSVIHCAAHRPSFSDHSDMPHCFNKIGQWWTHPEPRICLFAGAMILGATAYFHQYGWLGKQLFDRSASWREAQMLVLYRDMAWELGFQSSQAIQKNDPDAVAAVEKIARQILQNSNHIRARLIQEVQLSTPAAEKIILELGAACQKVLKKDSSLDLAPLAYLEKSADERMKELVTNLGIKWKPRPVTWNLIPKDLQAIVPGGRI